MRLTRNLSEVWVELHYRYKGEYFRFNLPLHRGEKYLDGLRIDFSTEDIPGGRHLKVVLEPLGKVDLESMAIAGSLPFGEDVRTVFVNGYQSWTGSRERSPGERISALNWPGRLLAMHKLGDAEFHRYSERKGRFHGYTYGYVRYPDDLLFVGSLDETSGFTVISTDVRRGLFSIRKDVSGLSLDSGRNLLDLVLLEGHENEVFDRYTELRNEQSCSGPRAFVWSGGHGKRALADEVKARRSLASFRDRKIPLDYFLIDDGWQTALGDWESSASGFPSGMASLATEIRGSGYLPGIWFAPFVVGVESEIYRTKKEWLARDSRNKIRPAGWLARHGGTFFALNLSREDVQNYITRSIRQIIDEWGFGFIRMDLLYAATVYPPQGASRGEAMNRGMELLASLKGNAVFEYAGVPLGSAFARGEYCRIAADTTPYWEHPYKRNIHCRERASTLNALRSTVGRRQLNGRFFSSSTASFYLGEGRKEMEPSRRYTQMLLHYLLSDLVSFSGDISGFDDETMAAFLSLFPMAYPETLEIHEFRRTVTVRYSYEGRNYISVSNLAERMRPLVLPEGFWFGAPGLKRRAHHVAGGGNQNLKPGESRNYMKIEDDFAGSDGHIFPGGEIASIKKTGNDWTVTPKDGVLKDFRVWIRHEGDEVVCINGAEVEVATTAPGAGIVSALVRVVSSPSSGLEA